MMIINAENKILGRLSTFVAKKLLQGEEVVIVNSEKALVKRKPSIVKSQYLEKIHKGNPYWGPYFPKRADLILKRTIRGMLPWKTTRGREAYKKLKCYLGVPNEFKNAKFEEVKFAEYDGNYKAITLEEISKTLRLKQQ
ncbi:MAG: 50S ribosomal protein L13 [Candidatus Woesearchaeota archaeon]